MRIHPKCSPAILLLALAGCPSTDHVVGSTTAASDDTGSGSDSETSAPEPATDTSGGDVVEDHRTFFIGESNHFDGGGACDNAYVRTVTSSLKERLLDAGWAGLRFVDDDSWPEDFRESTFSDQSLDGTFGDTARLSVYAGHGNVGMLQWGRPSDNGTCTNFINTNSRFGRLAGDTAAAVMLMTSCTMRADQLWPVFGEQASRQFFGFHNSPYIGPNEARKVFERSEQGQPTADAWLEEMVLNSGGKNSPVVFTMGTSPNDASDTHGITNLASGMGFVQNVGEPPTNFHFELFDSGCTKLCGNCSPNAAPPPEILLSAPVPRVKLTRPVRSAADLIERASTLLSRFEHGSLDDAARARLETWANTIVDSGDVTFAQILDEPRIDLSYDPASDVLRITNRDALARARPGPYGVVDDPADLRTVLMLEAEALREDLQTIPGMLDLLGDQFEVTARAVGYGGGDGPQRAPTDFEYIYTLPGELEGLALTDRQFAIGITRLGELSTIMVSMIDVEIVGSVGMQRPPQSALDALSTTLLGQHPSATSIEFVTPTVGYQLKEDEASGELDPSLLVGYVLAFGSGSAPAISRRVPIRLSLTELDAPIESLAAQDPDPTAGDARAAN